MRRTEALLLYDTSLLVTVCVLEEVSLTGLSVHEWLALAFAAVVTRAPAAAVAVDCLAHAPVLSPRARRARANYLLNLGLFIVMVATIASGIMISEVALPAVGRPNIGGIWRSFHGFTTNLVVLFVGLHVGLNGDWILAAVRRCCLLYTSPSPRDS